MAKKKPLKVRNETARAAWERQGAGAHQTGKKVTKSRGTAKRGSVGDQLDR